MGARWSALARTSRASWNTSRRSWKLTFMCVPNTLAARCQDGVSAAPLPPRPIPGGIAGPGLITEVIVSKFGDHLPLYRLEDILTRYGVLLLAQHPM